MTTGHKTKDSGSSSSFCRDKEVRGKQHALASAPHLLSPRTFKFLDAECLFSF